MNTVNFLNVEYIYLRIFDFFKDFDAIAILNTIIYYVSKLEVLSLVITLICLYVISYSYLRLHKLNKESLEKVFNATSILPGEATEPPHDEELHNKWQQVQAHINSENPSDWRLAILEADIILGDVLEKMGYQGDSIGDKLKSVDKSNFLTLNEAWEAHKVRNQIAHEGSDFLLNDREAKATIALYQKVFEEFYYL